MMLTTTAGNLIGIASDWHGGMWTALWQVSSTGMVHHAEHAEKILDEIRECLFNSPEEELELQTLKAYVLAIMKDKTYGVDCCRLRPIQLQVIMMTGLNELVNRRMASII